MKFEFTSVEWNGLVYLHFTWGVYKVYLKVPFWKKLAWQWLCPFVDLPASCSVQPGLPFQYGGNEPNLANDLSDLCLSTGRKTTPFKCTHLPCQFSWSPRHMRVGSGITQKTAECISYMIRDKSCWKLTCSGIKVTCEHVNDETNVVPRIQQVGPLVSFKLQNLIFTMPSFTKQE